MSQHFTFPPIIQTSSNFSISLPALDLVSQLKMKSFSFHMPEKVFIRPEFLKDIFVVIEFKVESLKFFFQCTKILPHYLLAFIVSYKKSSIILIFLLYLMHLCSLATYKIFSLALVSSNFVIICFGIIFFMFLVFGVYRDSWIRKFIIFMNLEIFPTILFLNRFFF